MGEQWWPFTGPPDVPPDVPPDGRPAGRPRRRPPALALLAVVPLLAGAVLALAGLLARPPAQPPPVRIAGAARPPGAGAATWRAGATGSHGAGGTIAPSLPLAPPMPFSAPVRVEVPAIGVNAPVISRGENPDGTVAVPSLATPQLTSWFDDGPAPGQPGPAAIFGHVDTAAAGPAVFYRLGDLTPGDAVDVTRADGSVARFQVYRVAEYAKDSFPTMAVYGDTPGAELRLITCGGVYDAAAGSYLDNIVAYARLVR